MTDAETKISVKQEQSPVSNRKKEPALIVISGTKIDQKSQSESAKKTMSVKPVPVFVPRFKVRKSPPGFSLKLSPRSPQLK